MKLAITSLNPIVGDVYGNIEKIQAFCKQAIQNKADLVLFPELSLIGYPPRDYLFFKTLLQQQQKGLKKLLPLSQKIMIVLGGYSQNKNPGKHFHNELFVLHKGKIKKYAKHLLPHYDVFDEQRYFEPGTQELIITHKGQKIGFSICEDIWLNESKTKRFYTNSPLNHYAKAKLDFLINISASPFESDKIDRRQNLLKSVAKQCGCHLVYVNQVGGNDDLIFDGGSTVVNASGKVLFQSERFVEEVFYWDSQATQTTAIKNPKANKTTHIKKALALGLRDYVIKSGFKKVCLGLSGGIDSAVVAALAVEALGKENVLGILMPSRYSSKGSVTDSKALAKNLGIKTKTIAIKAPHNTLEKLLKKELGSLSDLTEQNIQARIRGNILMAVSNNSGALLLNTTNKSELTMGYGTLYGDMCGALAVIGDLTKKQVYALAEDINAKQNIIPQAIITKAPSAELKPNQKDQDSLPAYSKLDRFVEEFTEGAELPKSASKKFVKAMMINEYKRFQAPPVLKVSGKAFGPGRRFPLVGKISL
ncbi:MAG: NAD+ synthase [Deltaproteobacteria bacterium]|nr:NAD+ synthase [Deltaproteobacteria bacterium]